MMPVDFWLSHYNVWQCRAPGKRLIHNLKIITSPLYIHQGRYKISTRPFSTLALAHSSPGVCSYKTSALLRYYVCLSVLQCVVSNKDREKQTRPTTLLPPQEKKKENELVQERIIAFKLFPWGLIYYIKFIYFSDHFLCLDLTPLVSILRNFHYLETHGFLFYE